MRATTSCRSSQESGECKRTTDAASARLGSLSLVRVCVLRPIRIIRAFSLALCCCITRATFTVACQAARQCKRHYKSNNSSSHNNNYNSHTQLFGCQWLSLPWYSLSCMHFVGTFGAVRFGSFRLGSFRLSLSLYRSCCYCCPLRVRLRGGIFSCCEQLKCFQCCSTCRLAYIARRHRIKTRRDVPTTTTTPTPRTQQQQQ